VMIGMDLSEREKFILHLSHSLSGVNNPEEVNHIIGHIIRNRCRSMTRDEARELMTAMRMELMLGRSMWE